MLREREKYIEPKANITVPNTQKVLCWITKTVHITWTRVFMMHITEHLSHKKDGRKG